MVKKIIEALRSDFEKMTRRELLESISLAEGRAVMAEVGPEQRNLGGITSAEIAAAFGADMVALNTYDVINPNLTGLPSATSHSDKPILAQVRDLAGVPIGLNLEPIDSSAVVQEKLGIPEGRKAFAQNALRAVEQGASFICLTGNPRTGVTNATIRGSLAELRKAVGDKLVLMGGKMHSAGVAIEASAHIISGSDIAGFAEAGCDVVLFPAPGSVPGIDEAILRSWVNNAHDNGMLAVSCLDLAIEGSDLDTIRRIALHSKMAGADLSHIGDAGFNVFPDNVMAYCIALKGKYHTYRRMAASPAR
jgi:hypothetical protein